MQLNVALNIFKTAELLEYYRLTWAELEVFVPNIPLTGQKHTKAQRSEARCCLTEWLETNEFL